MGLNRETYLTPTRTRSSVYGLGFAPDVWWHLNHCKRVWTLQIHFVHFVPLHLIWKWWPEQHCALVRPPDLDVRQLKYYLRCEGCYRAK